MICNDYDSVAEIYDLWVKADHDVPFFVEEARKTRGPVLELMAGTADRPAAREALRAAP